MRKLGLFALLGLLFALSKPTVSNADEQKWITIKGQIVLADGEMIVARAKIEPSQDKAHCLSKGDLLEERFMVNAKNRGVKNVFVWLGPDTEKKNAPFAPESINPKLAKTTAPVVVDQPCCMFIDHAVIARAGQDLIIKNSSPVPHNANWASKANGSGNIALPPGGQHKLEVPLVADRLPMEIKCNVHPWMNAWVRVFDHPYAVITDENGNFEMKLAPTGKFRLFVWHEAIGFRDGSKGRTGEVVELKGETMDLGKLQIKEVKE